MTTLRLLYITLFSIVVNLSIITVTVSFTLTPKQPAARIHKRPSSLLRSSFYDKFDDDEDEDDDDYDDLDDAAVADFRSKMSSLFGESEQTQQSVSSSVDELISYAQSQGKETTTTESTDWAQSTDTVKPGVVLLANPAKFCSDFGSSSSPSPNLLAKFGLTLPPPADLGPDRRADLLPVLMLVDVADRPGARAVLLNRRTGYLLGDLEQPGESPAPLLEKFCIQPLWFGGVDNVSSGLDMLHLCPTVVGAKKLTEDGLWWGGDPAQAQDAMEDSSSLGRVISGFDFKFFVQSTIWSKNELEKEIQGGTWFCAQVSKEVLFKSRDRMGTRRAKPLWTEIMELLGGECKDIRDQLYADESG